MSEILSKIEKAHRVVCDLCRPRGSAGAREWIMHVPAQPDYDPDLVIGGALRDAAARIRELESLLAETRHLQGQAMRDRDDMWLRVQQMERTMAEALATMAHASDVVDLPEKLTDELAGSIRALKVALASIAERPARK